jgi:hypothetical protein
VNKTSDCWRQPPLGWLIAADTSEDAEGPTNVYTLPARYAL